MMAVTMMSSCLQRCRHCLSQLKESGVMPTLLQTAKGIRKDVQGAALLS